MTKTSLLSVELNLRTRGCGIMVDSKDLYIGGVHNKFNQVTLKGYERLEHLPAATDEEVQDFLDEFRGKTGVKRGDTVMVIPRHQAQVQIADFPAEAVDSLDEVMEYQLENYFPGKLEEFDFFPQIVSKGEQLRVMIVAIRKEYLGQAFAFLRKTGMKLASLTLSTFGIVNGLAKSDPARFGTAKIAVFHFFHQGMEILCVNEGRLTASHYVPFDEEGLDPAKVTEELQEAFSLARMDANEIDTYLWMGSAPEELAKFLAEDLQFPRDEWTDTEQTVVSDDALPTFCAATAALHDKVPLPLNMLPEKLRKRHKRLPVILGAIVLTAAALFFLVTEVRQVVELRRQEGVLETRLDSLQNQAGLIASARNQFTSRQEEANLYYRYQANGTLLRLLETLSRELPDDTFLTSLQIKKGNKLTLRGESADPFKVQRLLAQVPYLRDVKPSNAITTGRSRDNKKQFFFSAEITLEAMR